MLGEHSNIIHTDVPLPFLYRSTITLCTKICSWRGKKHFADNVWMRSQLKLLLSLCICARILKKYTRLSSQTPWAAVALCKLRTKSVHYRATKAYFMGKLSLGFNQQITEKVIFKCQKWRFCSSSSRKLFILYQTESQRNQNPSIQATPFFNLSFHPPFLIVIF